MKKLLLVALGGATGSFFRYLLVEVIGDYPAAIFAANLVGVVIAGTFALTKILPL